MSSVVLQPVACGVRELNTTADPHPMHLHGAYYRVESQGDGTRLMENFRELHRIERILRRWSFEGEAVLPTDPAPFYRVSVRCGFESPEAFREAIAAYRKEIRDVYSKVVHA